MVQREEQREGEQRRTKRRKSHVGQNSPLWSPLPWFCMRNRRYAELGINSFAKQTWLRMRMSPQLPISAVGCPRCPPYFPPALSLGHTFLTGFWAFSTLGWSPPQLLGPKPHPSSNCPCCRQTQAHEWRRPLGEQQGKTGCGYQYVKCRKP